MTTNDDQYVPSEDEIISGLVQIPGEPAGIYRHVRVDEMKRGLAHVRRDAAREALDGLADEVTHVNWEMDGPSFALRVRRFKTRNHPEETP